MALDYQTLVAAREALRRHIAEDTTATPRAPESSFERNPDQMMRAYGMLAKLDKQIAVAEAQALSKWRSGEEGLM